MKVIVITQDENLYIPYYFRRFLDLVQHKQNIDLSKIYVVPSFDEGLMQRAARGFRFYGFWGFLQQGLRISANKILSSLGLKLESVSSLGAYYSVPVENVKNINEPSFISALKEQKPDVILSVAAPQIFKKELLKVPQWGCINVHSAKLPKYRGMMPNFWAMYHGDKKAGITVHTMDEKLDQGKIVLQDEIEIRENDTLDSLVIRSKKRGAELVVDALEQIKSGDVELRNYKGEASLFSFPTRQDVKVFKSRGKELL